LQGFLAENWLLCHAVMRTLDEGLRSCAGAPPPLNLVEFLDDDIMELLVGETDQYAAAILALQAGFKVCSSLVQWNCHQCQATACRCSHLNAYAIIGSSVQL
jgi:hypothetical protein